MPDPSSQPAGTTILRRLLIIALPMIVSQASETAMMFVDRLFLSRVSQLHLSAAMGGGLTTFAAASLFVGIAGYTNAIVAQYYGAGQRDQCAKAATQALYFAVFASPILITVARFVPHFFQLMGHDPGQIPLETVYAQWLMSGAVILLMRSALTGFFLGIGKTRIVMVSNIIGMLVNIPVNYVLIFGALGFPALGMVGAAIGTLAGGIVALLVLLVSYLGAGTNARFRTRAAWRFNVRMFRRLLRFGSPAGVEIFLNVMAFNLFVQMMHGYGADVAAAITIAFNWDIVAFIPMLGLGLATTAIVGQYIGAGDPVGARTATLLALRLGLVYSGSMMLLFFVAARPLVGVFSAGFGDSQSVSVLAITMLRLVGLYTIADVAQLVFAGALRGAGDTAWVMRTSAILHWVFATVVFVLIRVVEAQPITVWICFIGFVMSLGVAMVLRFRAGKWQTMRVI